MTNLKKIRRKILRPIEAGTILLALLFIKCFTLKGARRLADFFGLIIYAVPAQRNLALKNLATAYPEKSLKERKKIARKSIQGVAKVFIEFIWFYNRPQLIKQYIKVSPEVQNMYEKFKEPHKPAIVLAMHWGNWELAPAGFKIIDNLEGSVIARKLKNPALEKIMLKGREEKGLTVIHEKGAARHIVKALKNKVAIGMLVDQNTKTHQGGTFGNFFGLPVTISKTPGSLARKMKTMVLLVNCERTKTGFEMKLKFLPKKVDEYRSDNQLSEDILKLMESFVREKPEHWVWIYKRWNYIPSNWKEKKELFPDYAELDDVEFTQE